MDEKGSSVERDEKGSNMGRNEKGSGLERMKRFHDVKGSGMGMDE